MTETPEQNQKRLKYEIGATVRPEGSSKLGYSYWPNGIIALSFWREYATVFNSNGVFVAKWKVKSWK